MAPSVSSDAVGARASDDEASVKKRKKKSKDKDKERRKRKDREAEDGGEPAGKKRSKKRARDADADDANDGEPEAVAEPVVDAQPRKKRRKKKKQGEPDDEDEDAQIDPVLRMLAPAPPQSHDPNAEILHILQSVDISKIDVDALFNNVPQGSVPHFPAPQSLPAHSQPASRPAVSVAKPKAKAKAKTTKSRPKSSAIVRASPPPRGVAPASSAAADVSQPENTPEHVALLTTKWLTSKKLEQLIQDEGLLVKKGKFSVMEEKALRAAVEKYRFDHNLTQDELHELIFTKFKRDGNTSEFWTSLALQVPQRTLVAIYHWVKRVYNPLSKQGKWTEDEDIALLEAMGDVGQAWEKLSERVGRTASDCRDRWRNHLVYRESRNTGPWSEEEEEELTRIVRAMTLDKGKSADSDVFWTEVAHRMENKRSRQQCRVKWTDGLNKRVKNDGQTPRWTPDDGLKLIMRVEALNVRHDSEINWNSLNDASWNLWSAHQLQRRWLTLKRAIRGHDQMPLRELLDVLKARKGILATSD